MLIDFAILIVLALFAINGFRRGFLVLAGRLLVLILSIGISVLMLGPTSRILEYLPFLQPFAQEINERVIRPLLPVAGTLSDAISKLDLPNPIQELMLAQFPDKNSPLLEAWPQLSGALAKYAISALTFLALLLLVSVTINMLIALMTDAFDRVPIIGYFNHLIGFILGGLHGLLIISICILVAGFIAPYVPKLGLILQDSQLVAAFFRLDLVAAWIARFLAAI